VAAGRKPKPTALKLVQGNPGKRALNTAEPQPQRGIPECPDWLSPLAKEHWIEIAPRLDELGVLTLADGHALALLCETFAEYRKARADVVKHGATYWSTSEDGSKLKRANPNVAIASDAAKRYRGLLAEFGLTPSSRTKVSTAPNSEVDPLDVFLGGRTKR
jgi:P27 family predicted phage terminase small subunit